MAAAQGQAVAQYELVNLYAAGDGIPQGGARALALYQEAVAQGETRAYVRIGDLYRDGDGINQSYVEANGWYAEAAMAIPRGCTASARPTSAGTGSRPIRYAP